MWWQWSIKINIIIKRSSIMFIHQYLNQRVWNTRVGGSFFFLLQWGESLYQKVLRRRQCQWWFVTDAVMRRIKGTNGRQKTYEILHVYCIFYSGFMCQTTVIFGITKYGSLVLNTLASWNCFTCRNLFQNGANDMSECLTCETAFCKKAQNFV